jgi:ribosomal protein L21E
MATPRNTTNTTNTTIERDSLGYLIFKVGDLVKFERDKKFPYPRTGKRDKYEGQTGQVTQVTERYVHVQLHRPTRFKPNVKRGKMSVVHASM